MFNHIIRCLAVIACLGLGSGPMRPAAAQHHGGGHGGSHHGGGHGSSHHGGYHSGWQHVVPSHHHHSGLYYSYGNSNYYTPVLPSVQVEVLRPQYNAQPGYSSPPAIPVAPIAPQSVKLEFGGFQQIEDLSGRLETEANRWCLDMHYNYRLNPGFVATYGEAYKILLAAKYVHSAEHRQDREGIRAELTAVEPLFHHVQNKIKAWTAEQRRPVGAGDINAKADIVEAILHHLLYDVGIEPDHSAAEEEQAPAPAEVAPPPVLPAAR